MIFTNFMILMSFYKIFSKFRTLDAITKMKELGNLLYKEQSRYLTLKKIME